MKKFVTLGNECVEYLKATRASEGKFSFLCFACLECLSLLLYLTSLSSFVELQMPWQQLMLASHL
jgi:hypothetical protein